MLCRPTNIAEKNVSLEPDNSATKHNPTQCNIMYTMQHATLHMGLLTKQAIIPHHTAPVIAYHMSHDIT